MSYYMIILSFAAVVVSIFSLVYTFYVAKEHQALKGNQDYQIPEKVQKHAYIRNPIFLTFLIFFMLILLYILYMAVARY